MCIRDRAYHAQAGAALQALFTCRHPTIALIQGPCIGGGLELAAQCDLRICGESSRFGAPINKLGFSMYPAAVSYTHLNHAESEPAETLDTPPCE